MDFFQEQDSARRNTRWLVVLYLMAVVVIVVALYFVAVAILAYSRTDTMAQPVVWWQPQLFVWVAGATSAVIFSVSLFKVMTLSSGGGAKVAESLGGRRVARATEDRLERRLLNVVDEMAIASGIPVPQVYVLDDEPAINAFAAGASTNNAVVAVTRGTLEQLNRDELQGVVGHEFSHIFNGDMRLNIRLMGVLFGILALAQIGRSFLRGSSRRRYRSSSSNSGKSGGGIIVFALALFVIGYIGVFFARLIKAAVSRQREFLADASAVQFTRNPSGIAGALKKIAGFESTHIEHPDAESVSHMFFGNGVNNFLALLATHPPVEERISRLDPYFKIEQQSTMAAPVSTKPSPQGAMGFSETTGVAVTPETVRASVGNVEREHVNYAQSVLEGLPEALWKAVREPQGAHATALALVLVTETSPADVLDKVLPELDIEITKQTLELVGVVKEVERANRLPLLELLIPALEELPEATIKSIPKQIEGLIRADKRVTLFEFSLSVLLRHSLSCYEKHGRKKAHGGLKQINDDIGQLLSLMVHVGHKEPAEAEAAFRQAISIFDKGDDIRLIARDALSLKAAEEALERLEQLNFRFKGKIIEAASAAISADGEIKVNELDFLRAIGASLDCPIPPLQVGQWQA